MAEKDPKESAAHTASWQNAKAKNIAKALLTLAIFLTTLASIGSGLYVSIVAFPAITAALTTAFAFMALPYAVITCIATLPMIIMSAVLLRFLQIHLSTQRAYHKPSSGLRQGWLKTLWHAACCQSLHSGIGRGSLKKTAHLACSDPLTYTAAIVAHAFLVLLDPSKGNGSNALKTLYTGLAFSALAALGLGIWLSVQILPTLLAAVTTLGLPSLVLWLFVPVLALTCIVITYQLIVSPLILLHTASLLYDSLKKEPKEGKLAAYSRAASILFAIGLSMTFFILLFPLLANTLAVMLIPSLATLTTVATLLSLTVLMIKLLPTLLVDLPQYLYEKCTLSARSGHQISRLKSVNKGFVLNSPSQHQHAQNQTPASTLRAEYLESYSQRHAKETVVERNPIDLSVNNR